LLRYLLASSTLAAALLGLALAATGTAKAAGRHAAMVIDANTGQVLHAASADAPRYPASLTKMMTIYLAFEEIERGRLTYATKIRVSEEAASAAPTKLDLPPGSQIALIDAIKALITKSANDMAIAVAEHMAGSEAEFAERMTDKARQIGMAHTTFKNASGLPHPGQVTTARDMLTLALRLQDDFPRHYSLFATRSFTYNNHTYRNHNGLLGSYAGTDGIKTGYTRRSGFNLVSSVRRGKRHVVGAVFGGASAGTRNAEMRRLLSRALMKASPVKTRKSAPMLVAQPKPAVRPQPKVAIAVAPPASRPLPEASEAFPAERARVEPMLAAAVDSQSDAPAHTISIAKVRSVALTPQPRLAALSPPHTAPTVKAAAPARGMPPSTLQQQADNLRQSESPPTADATAEAPKTRIAAAHIASQPTYRLKGPEVPVATPAATGDFEIQIGAYTSAAEARLALAAARDRANDLLAGAAPAMTPTQKGRRQLYRARFGGFSGPVATNTCQELRRRQIDCFVTTTE
jgi:D-alanyl-D-alanine carboxypeptidase